MKSLCASLILCLVAFGCSKTNTTIVGGGNDFPNPSALGKIIIENLSMGDNWGDSVALPAASSPFADAQSLSMPTGSLTGMAKKTGSQTLHIDLSDTGKGIIRVYYGNISDSVIKNDTAIFLYDDVFRDNVKKDKHLYLIKGSSMNERTHILSWYQFVDSDGDSIINNRDGKPNRVLVSGLTIGPLGASTGFEIEIDGGADGNLDTKEDMRILKYKTLGLSKEGDTVAMADYRCYGSDSTLFDASRRDSMLVRVLLVDSDLSLRKTRAEAIFAIFPSDSAKNRALFFRSEKSLDNGIAITHIIRGAKPDSLLAANDTALAYRIVESADDSVSLDTLRLQALIGKNLSDSTGNSLLELYNHRTKRIADDRETIFSLTCNPPIAKNEKPQSGSFFLKIIYRDGLWLTVTGSFFATGITAKYEDSKGNSLNLSWDKDGRPTN